MALRPDPPREWRSVLYPLPDYTYFAKPAAFAGAPTIGRLNVLKAAWMADASMLAYGRSGMDRLSAMQFAAILQAAGFQHFDVLGDWSGTGKGTQGFFGYTNAFAVLAFRGTEADDLEDLATDLATWPVEEGTNRATFDEGESAVHHGFQVALDEVWEQAEAELTEYRSQSSSEIFFTGHSLGAALATLAIARFEGGNASLYTFGSPRVGNRTFVARAGVRATLGQFRMVDENDLVTRVPPGLFGYTHGAATLYQIDGQASIVDQTANPVAAGDSQEMRRDLKCLSELKFPVDLYGTPPDDLYDHSPGRYCNRIWNAAG